MEANVQDQSLTGFGVHSAQEVEELQKALSVGNQYATQTPGQFSGGAALAVEDLDRTLKLVTFGLEHLRLWRDIIKQKVTQVVHEFNVQNSYGAEVSPFFQMGLTPTATDASYNRDVFQVKYLGTQGQVQHNLTMIQAAHGKVVAREVKNKTIELLSRNERAMFEANSAINALEYDGIDAQLRLRQSQAKYQSTAFAGYDEVGSTDSIIMDASATNQILDEDLCEDACLRAINNFGYPMDMYLATDVHSKFSKAFYAKVRTAPGDRTAAGYLVPDFQGSLNFKFKPNLFNRARVAPLASAISAASAPAISSPVNTPDASSLFTAASAGAYGYKISAVYADGETLPSSAQTVTVSAGDIAKMTITYSGSPLYFNVFRTAKADASGTVRFIGRIAPAGTGVSHVIDVNAKVPGSSSAYLLMHDPDVIVWKQLGSLIKYDLAVTNTSYQWLQLLYGGVNITAPRKNILIQNITLPASV